jgi:mannose-1-phosphate guanylyltransferase
MSKSNICSSIEEKCANLITELPSNRVALLLAGGDGVRLQELTREIAGVPIPKQYCRLLHGSSLLEAALSRAHLFAPRERINIVINQNHLGLAKEQLRDLPESNIFVQPLNRDTGPGMIFSLLQLELAYPDAIVAVFPTDHYVDNERAFITHVLRAVNTISRMPDKIAVLGIVPDRPETGYGYILPAEPLGIPDRAYYVQAFTEKPNFDAARRIIARGGLWNTFVIVFQLSRMMKLLHKFVPEQFEQLSKLRGSPEKFSELYKTLDSWSLSARVLSQIPQHLILFEVADVRWSDWGTRESIERTYTRLNLAPFWDTPRPVSNAIPGITG